MAKRILVIDDDRTICALLEDTLQSFGYQVTVTHDAIKGMEAALSAAPPDLILLDMQLPGGGPYIYMQLGREEKTKGIPVFFTTALSEDEVRQMIPSSPQCKGYFSKPFNFPAMLPAIEKALAQ